MTDKTVFLDDYPQLKVHALAQPIFDFLGVNDFGEAFKVIRNLQIRASLNWREVKALETVESGTRIHSMKGIRAPGYTEPEVIARLVKLGLLKESDKDNWYELA